MKKLIIDRKIWARGETSAHVNKLLDFRSHGSGGARAQCCIGIYLSSCGMTDEQIGGLSTPADFGVLRNLPDEARWLVTEKKPTLYDASDVACDLIGANDRAYMPDREERIKALFATQGIEVEFVNDGCPGWKERGT